MTNRRLLYLNTHRLSAYAWRQGKLLPEEIFENDEAGFNLMLLNNHTIYIVH